MSKWNKFSMVRDRQSQTRSSERQTECVGARFVWLHFASVADERGALKSPLCIIQFSKEHTHTHLSLGTKTHRQTHSALMFVSKCQLPLQKVFYTLYINAVTRRQGEGRLFPDEAKDH